MFTWTEKKHQNKTVLLIWNHPGTQAFCSFHLHQLALLLDVNLFFFHLKMSCRKQLKHFQDTD